MNGVAVIFNFRLINSLKAFYFGKREKLLKLVKKKIICQYCYLCYAFYNLLIAGILFFRPRIKIKSDIIRKGLFEIDTFPVTIIFEGDNEKVRLWIKNSIRKWVIFIFNL